MRRMRLAPSRAVWVTVLCLSVLPDMALFAQAAAPPTPQAESGKVRWSFELPFELQKIDHGEQNVSCKLWDANGDGTEDLVIVARGTAAAGRRDFEAFALDGASGARLWHAVLPDSAGMEPRAWFGPFLLMMHGWEDQTVLDLRTGQVRTDLPEFGDGDARSPQISFDRTWSWGDEAVVAEYWVKTGDVMRAAYLRIPAKAEGPVESYPLEPACPGIFTETRALLHTGDALVCLDRRTGAVLWRMPLGKQDGCAFLGADATHVAVGRTKPSRLCLLSLDTGAEVWSKPLKGSLSKSTTFFNQPLLMPDCVVSSLGYKQGIAVFSRASGEILWEQDARGRSWLIPVSEKAFALRESTRFRIFRPATREPVLDLALGAVESLSTEAPRVYLVSRINDKLLAVDRETLKVLWEKQIPLAQGSLTLPTPVVCDRFGNRLVAFYRKKVVLLDGGTGAEKSEITEEQWRTLWPLRGYDRFLEFAGGGTLRCVDLAGGFQALATKAEARKLDLVVAENRVVAREGRVFRMMDSPCPEAPEPSPDGLADIVPFLRRMVEYTANWSP